MTGPAVTETESSAPSLGDSISEMLGDFGGGESPEPLDSAAETTSAEPVDGTATEPATETAVETPSAEPTSVAADQDPFQDTTPAQYVVNGQSIPVEDIRVFKEGGAVIRPESLPNVLSKLAERDTLSERARTRDAEYQTLSRVSEWTGPDNKTITGPEAAIERIVAHAAVLSENQLILSYLTDPDKLYSLLTTEQIPDGQGGLRERVILSPVALDNLKTLNENRQIKATQAIRDHYRGIVAESAKGQPAPINYEQAAPELVAQIAQAANLNASVLTPEDKHMLAEQLPFHVKDGLASTAWQNLVKRTISDRTAQHTSAQTLVTSTAAATKTGLSNMAAAARGMRQPVKPATPVPVRTPQQERSTNEGDLYEMQERAAARAIRASR